MHDDIGDIAMHKEFPWKEVHDLVGWHATICATDPKILWALLLGESFEEFRVSGDCFSGPATVVFLEMGEFHWISRFMRFLCGESKSQLRRCALLQRRCPAEYLVSRKERVMGGGATKVRDYLAAVHA
jgi:hypothetical protein